MNYLPERLYWVRTSKTGTTSQVAANVTAVQILPANDDRRAATFYYDGAAVLYLIFSDTTPTSSAFSVKMGDGYYTYVELPDGYRGIVRGIWSAAVGEVAVTEFAAVTTP